ncbi:MAG: methyltransferase [Bacteroidetes bacterium]|nr:MAG: methyltransferase [Bacteroidota bacterium]
MTNNHILQPLLHELPSQFADRLGIEYASSISQEHKKSNGQFFTPITIASFMASFAKHSGKSVRILDPGCGSAILSCSLIEHLINSNNNLTSIELVAYETDLALIPVSENSLDYLKKWIRNKGIDIKTILIAEDFVLHNSDCFIEHGDLFAKPVELFDIIISNPPYFKLPINDKRAVAAKIVVNGHPNIYAIFMALSARLLHEDGDLIFITPRSYASGGYFKIFREYFFSLIELNKVHLFISRKKAFSRDKILQETVIIKGTRNKNINPYSQVTISSSDGLQDLSKPTIKVFPKKDIIDMDSSEKILYLPTSDKEEAVLGIFKNWSGNLSKYNIKISTGPVVAFRSRDYIREIFENEKTQMAPLFWLHNVKQMILEWPITKPQKGQYISIKKLSKSILIPNKNYILLRRFSSKDDKNRLIAAPYFSNFIDSDYIGVENKVNYIYRPNGYLERNEIIGLCALLNSALFDTYFRIFNGNVNVSATELRIIPLPSLDLIREMGDAIILSNNFSVENTNQTVINFIEPVYSI